MTWPWQTRRGERPNSVLVELEETEQDCMRRLDYVDAQLGRALRTKASHWSAAMTVADADIMPVGRSTQVMTAMRSMRDWHWYVAIGVGAVLFLAIVVSIAMCGDTPPTPPEIP
jgi:hypothetical protein